MAGAVFAGGPTAARAAKNSDGQTPFQFTVNAALDSWTLRSMGAVFKTTDTITFQTKAPDDDVIQHMAPPRTDFTYRYDFELRSTTGGGTPGVMASAGMPSITWAAGPNGSYTKPTVSLHALERRGRRG